MRDVQLSGGPAWADREDAKLNDAVLYQVIGKAYFPPGAAIAAANRFQLKVHRVQRRGEPRLLLKPPPLFIRGQRLGQNLERDLAADACVAR